MGPPAKESFRNVREALPFWACSWQGFLAAGMGRVFSGKEVERGMGHKGLGAQDQFQGCQPLALAFSTGLLKKSPHDT